MRLLFDATTTLTWADRPPVGTVRVERLFLRDLCRRLPPDRLAFLKFRHGRFVPVSEAQRHLIRALALEPLQQLAPPEPAAGKDGTGWRTWATRQVKRPLKALRRPAARGDAPDLRGFTDFVTLGHGWDYLDHAELERMKARSGLRVHGFVHDLIAVSHPHYFYDPAKAGSLRRHYAELCRLANVLVANSQATRAALERFIAVEGLPRPSLHVAPLPAFLSAADHPRAALPVELQSAPFVLYVSTLEVRKNHRLLLRLWSERARAGQPLPRLVLVGRVGWAVEEATRMLHHDPALAGNVTLLSDVADDRLAALYRHCLFCVYPSCIEGWGLPITEALTFGKICLHADDPAQKEASQGLMPVCHPDDYPTWKAEILSLVADARRRAGLEAMIGDRFRPRSDEAFCADMRAALGLG